MKERRKYPRIPISILINLIEENSGSLIGQGCIKNLSVGGIALESDAKLTVGKNLFLKINIPIEVIGKIVWAEQYGKFYKYGIKFKRIGLFDKIKLKKYVEKNLKNILVTRKRAEVAQRQSTSLPRRWPWVQFPSSANKKQEGRNE